MGGRGGNGSKNSKKSGITNNKTGNNKNYKLFKDEARDLTGSGWGGFEYTGDGQEQEDWFKQYSNYEQLINGMSYDEAHAFREWASGIFMEGGMYKPWATMRGAWGDTQDAHDYVRAYDKILDQAILKRGLIVSRDSTAELVMGKGHKTATLAELKAAEGRIVPSKSAISTGAASTGLSIGDSSKQILYRIQIPAGSKGAGMWIADSRIHGWGRKQLEFMINRDSLFKVGTTVWNDRYQKYVVTLTWLGHDKHKYK